ncbi:hypothetical protein, partial [Staphylococcus microti]|uniref:hypothetical protein n=1 Tax=Staphylococcus microti TaxID=569857 RepID=UPI00197DA260
YALFILKKANTRMKRGIKILIVQILKVWVLTPLLLTFIFNIPNFACFFYEKCLCKLKIAKFSSNIPSRNKIMIYLFLYSILLLIAFFTGFYPELDSVNDKQSGYLYGMYFMTFIMMYTVQYLSLIHI